MADWIGTSLKRLTVLSAGEILWLLAVALTPLVMNPWGLQVFELPKAALLRTVAPALAIWWLWQVRHSRRPVSQVRARFGRHSSDPRLWAVLCAVAAIAATLSALDVPLAFWGSHGRQQGLLTILAYLLLFCVVSSVPFGHDQVSRLALVITLGTAPVVAYGLVQGLGLDPLVWQSTDKSPILSTLGRSNFVGAYLAMSLPLGAVAIHSARGPYARAALIIVVVCSAMLLALTRARSSWIALLVGLAIVTTVRLLQTRGWRQVALYGSLAVAASLVLIGSYVATLQMMGRTSLIRNVESSLANGSFAARLAIWESSLRLVAQRPLLGYGFDNFSLAFYHVFPPQLVFYQGRDVVTDRAHDLLLDLAVSEGIVGAALYTLLISTILIALVGAFSRAPDSERPFVAAILTTVVIHLVDLVFSFDVTSTGVIFWVVAGAGVGIVNGQSSAGHPTTSMQYPRMASGFLKSRARSLVLLIVILMMLTAASATQVAADTFAGQALRPGLSWSDRAGTARFAVRLWPWEPDYWAESGSLYLDRANGEGNLIENLDLAENALYTAANLRPLDPMLWAGLAAARSYRTVTLRDEAFDSAETDYRRATSLAPTAAKFHSAYGTAALAAGHYNIAESELETAVRFDPTDGRTWYYLAQAYQALGRDQVAHDAFDLAGHLQN